MHVGHIPVSSCIIHAGYQLAPGKWQLSSVDVGVATVMDGLSRRGMIGDVWSSSVLTPARKKYAETLSSAEPTLRQEPLLAGAQAHSQGFFHAITL